MIKAPNYTQTPNVFFDEIMRTLNESELRVMLVIMRKTFGWQKERDRISLSQIQEMTGMSRQGVLNGLYGKDKKSGLIGSGYVISYSTKGGNEYEINTEGSLEVVNEADCDKPVNEVDQTSQQSRPDAVNQVDQQNENTGQQSRHTKQSSLNKHKRKSLKKELPQESERLSKLMVELHQKYWDPKYNPKESNVEGWRNDIFLLHSKDGRTWQEIEAVIRFAKTMPVKNGFTWATNIMSGAKLREKFDTLFAQATAAKPGLFRQQREEQQRKPDHVMTDEEKRRYQEEFSRQNPDIF